MKTRPVRLFLATLGSLIPATLASLTVATLASLTLAVPASLALAVPTGNAANGRRVYLADGCFYCHGTTGAGGGIAGPRLAPNPLPLEGVKAKVRTASGRMPVYSPAVLKDAEIADIVAYLQSIPQGKAAKDIPALNR
jgi:mono/diheme cytochrome c family protein